MNPNVKTHKLIALALTLVLLILPFIASERIFKMGGYLGEEWRNALVWTSVLCSILIFIAALLLAVCQAVSLRLFSSMNKDLIPAYSTRLASQLIAFISAPSVLSVLFFILENLFPSITDPSVALYTRVITFGVAGVLILFLCMYYVSTNYAVSKLAKLNLTIARKANIIPTGILSIFCLPLIGYYLYAGYHFEIAIKSITERVHVSTATASDRSPVDSSHPVREPKTVEEYCTPKSESSQVFRHPSRSSDTFFERNKTGMSWSIKIERSVHSESKEFKAGKLVSPRGGIQDGVFYILVNEWNCVE